MVRRKLFTTAAVAAALGMGGCVPLITEHTAAQKDVVGDVALTTKACDIPFLLGLEGLPIYRSGAPRGFDATDVCSEELFEELAAQDIPVGVPHQLLAGYRVPAGTKAPDTITATAKYVPFEAFYDNTYGPERGRGAQDLTPQTATITFRKSDSYGAKLPEFLDTFLEGESGDELPSFLGAGQTVAGYVSDVVPGHLVGEFTVTGSFGLPQGSAADQPYTGPLNHFAVMGSRWAGSTPEHEEAFEAFFEFLDGSMRAGRADVPEPSGFDVVRPDRPVDCGSDRVLDRAARASRGGPVEAIIGYFSQVDFTVCGYPFIEDLLEGGDEPEWDKLFAGQDLATRDLRVLPGEGFAEQGATATVPFKVRTAGAQGGELDVNVTTTLPGVAPQSRKTTFSATGVQNAPVSIAVPADAVPGTYPVTLTIGSGTGVRSAKGSVVVLPKPTQPANTPVPPRDNVYMGRDGSIAFGLTCSPSCGNLQSDVLSMKAGIAPNANTAAVSKPRLLRIAGKKSFKTTAGKRTRAKVKLFPKARKAIQKGRTVKAILVIRAGGKGTPIVRRLVVRPASQRK